MAPPRTFSLSPPMARSLAGGVTWGAEGSVISTQSMSSMVMSARARVWRIASTGPRPMISGLRPDTPLATMRASGVMPSSRALVSLMTTTAAAPSLSGQALPAVMVPPSRKTGFRPASPSRLVPGRGPSSFVTTSPLGVMTGMISRPKKPDSWDATARVCDCRANSSCSSRLTCLNSATFSAVWPMAMYTSGRTPSSGAPWTPLDRAGFGDGEQFVVGSGIGRSEAVAADCLDPGGDEDVALAGPDGVRGHANGLEGRRAVPVDGHAGHVGEAGQQRDHAAQVVAGLAAGLAVAEDEVLDRVGIELGHLGQHLAHDQCGQVVGPAVDQRTLVGPSDRGPAGGDDYGFGHVMLLVEGGGAAALVRSWTAVAAGIRQDVPFATYRMVARAVPGGGWMHHAVPPVIRRSVPGALSVPPSDGGATCGLNVTCSSSGRSAAPGHQVRGVGHARGRVAETGRADPRPGARAPGRGCSPGPASASRHYREGCNGDRLHRGTRGPPHPPARLLRQPAHPRGRGPTGLEPWDRTRHAPGGQADGGRRLAGHRLAHRVWRPGPFRHRAVHLLRRVDAGRRPGAHADHQHGGTHHHGVRHSRTEGAVPAAHPGRRHPLLHRLHRARVRYGPRLPADPGRA